MQIEFFIPARLRARLDEPELPLGVKAELGVHNHAAVGLADDPDGTGDIFGLSDGQRPFIDFFFRNTDSFGAALGVINDFLVLAAQIADNDFRAVVALEDIVFIRRDHTADNGLTQAIAGIDAYQILAASAPAAGCGVRAERGTGNDGIDHAHNAYGKRRMLNGPFLFGLLGEVFISCSFGAGDAVADGFPAIGHGAQIIGGSAIPVIGQNDVIFSHHVQIRVLQAGESFLARIFSGGRRTDGNRHIHFTGFGTDVAVGLTHGFVHVCGHGDGKNGGLHQYGTFAQLVNAFLRGRKAFYHIVDKGTEADTGRAFLLFCRITDLFSQIANQFLQKVGILVDFRIIPVDPRVFPLHKGTDKSRIDRGFIQNFMEADG